MLESSAHLLIERGLANVSLEAVARHAGVSKGGLLHHFPSRQALLEDVFQDILHKLDEQIQLLTAKDNDERGRFTRAYILAFSLPLHNYAENKLLASACLIMNTDPGLAKIWSQWLQGHISNSRETSPLAYLLRYSADGIWLEDSVGGSKPNAKTRKAVINSLIAMSYNI